MDEYFKQNYYLRSANVYIELEMILLNTWKGWHFFDNSFEKINYVDLIASVLSSLNETSEREPLCRSKG